MTTTLELSARSRTPIDDGRPVMPILIRVPALTASSRKVGRPGARRRRLRKEVRVAGLTMMSVLPLCLLLLTLGGARPADRPTTVAASAAISGPGEDEGELLTFDTETSAPATTATVPVVFPGYLLPVDGPEEPAHAGR